MEQTKSTWSYYQLSVFATMLAVLCGFVIGGWQMAFTVAVLSVLETSLSLDNAVVNAKILENWDEHWRNIFLKWGILVAVFGMRFVFPIIVVCVTTGLGPVAVVQMALYQPDVYAAHMTEAHFKIAGFGGTFLLMVALGFFFAEKHVYWMEWAETKLTHLGQIEAMNVGVSLTLLFLARYFVSPEHQAEFFMSGVAGIMVFIAVHGMGSLVQTDNEDEETTALKPEIAKGVIKAGLAGFLYIEVLDASFSFDGVIGAFVLTTYLPAIMLGLGAGAFFVRSFTIHLVEKGTLGEYKYLEHGAFYAILVLAAIMLSPMVHLPEWVTGLAGALILALAMLHSIYANRREIESVKLDATDIFGKSTGEAS